jgi:hypothetical protein
VVIEDRPSPPDTRPTDPRPDEPAPKPKKPQAPGERELGPILARLKSGSQEERVAAADELARMGDKAQPATRALCESVTDPSQKVSRAALIALEKINPELQQQVFVLVIDDSAANHKQALNKIGHMGEKAQAAVPVLVHEIKRCEDDLNDQLQGRGIGRGRPWQSVTLLDVIAENMVTLPKIAPEDPLVVRTLVAQTQFKTEDRFFRLGSRPFPLRARAVQLLGDLAEDRAEHRKEIIPAIVAVLNDAAKHTESSQDIEVLAGIGEVDSACHALLKCGPDAKPTLTKDVLPRLKDLQFHKSAQVRQAAEKLRKSIEDAP